ncbi:hypothetical protein [Deinococcus ruber]|nr:hypothetical protein [Deinococcus ruber]
MDDPILSCSLVSIQIDRLARQHGGLGSSRHHAVLGYQAFLLQERLGPATAEQLRISSERVNSGRRYWYDTTDVTISLLSVASELLLNDTGVDPSYQRYALQPPTTHAFKQLNWLHRAQAQVMYGAYLVVALLDTTLLREEAERLARTQVWAVINAGLVEGREQGRGELA